MGSKRMLSPQLNSSTLVFFLLLPTLQMHLCGKANVTKCQARLTIPKAKC